MMDVIEVQNYLPHRYPMLLVDGVESVTVGETIRAWKNISGSDLTLQGHFPGNPIFPGVLVIEAMTQAAGILGFKTAGQRPADGLIYVLAGVDKVRFKRQVKVGDRLDLVASVVTNKGNFWKFSCQSEVQGEVTCSAEILCAIVDDAA